MNWTSDWSKIDNQKSYLCCAIATHRDTGIVYPYMPSFMAGWQVKQCKEGCYIATEWNTPKVLKFENGKLICQ